MEPYQQRVVNEQRELAEKLERLGEFIGGETFKGLVIDEQVRLIKQQAAMLQYRAILLERVDHFDQARWSDIEIQRGME